ncbi:non-homologous end-joining DNA ligase [Glycomyces rhizosphaerae]|uniref:Non-homologous end-joining DNA ligase n=1 Tax=Glycomyces rhizosphaerae TaxID=2054422 RepID=A0ABV7Q7X7_9ACTN
MAPPTIHVEEHDIKVSNLDRMLFPADHFSKGDMLLHYGRVAPAMVPHLAGRPLTLRRYPEGISSGGFFQKDASDYFPDWINTVEVAHRHSDGTVRYVVCEDAATLLYLANQGTIEFHIWTSTVDQLDHPDRLVMDLDPPAGVTVATIRSVARRARKLFTELGLTPFLQATGGRGYHVVAPLDRSADFRFVRDLAGDIADHLAAGDPDLLTTAQRKQKRGNRIYLDMNRNGSGQTFVAPYSLRARPGAAVATPLDWAELGESTPNGFTAASISRRLAQKTDPWADMDEHAAAPATARKRLDALDRRSAKADLPRPLVLRRQPARPSTSSGRASW